MRNIGRGDTLAEECEWNPALQSYLIQVRFLAYTYIYGSFVISDGCKERPSLGTHEREKLLTKEKIIIRRDSERL